MELVINNFLSVITDFNIKTNKVENKVIINSEIRFVDGSKLNVYISDNKISIKHKYSFHWQNTDNQMTIRWDNAPHHPNISTFPHHKHIETDLNVHPSTENTLHDVLTFISQKVIASAL